MGRRILLRAAACAACLVLGAGALAFTARGDDSDVLISRSYLEGTFLSAVTKRIAEIKGSGGASDASAPAAWVETRYKSGDRLTPTAGAELMLLAGSARAELMQGVIIDTAAGLESSGSVTLQANRRYLFSEDARASVSVTGKTAVIETRGAFDTALSTAVDYNAIASALKTVHLFKGSLTGFGSGYDLEKAPTRLQALIMFIRVLGEEEAALAWTGSIPFTDVAAGSLGWHYVGYAYERGYTNGYSATAFKPGLTINAPQYTEFLLRALGYSRAGEAPVATALTRAQEDGVLTAGEVSAMSGGTFLRADLVYLSWYALRSPMASQSETLDGVLRERGVYTGAEYRSASAMIPSERL